MIRTSEKQDIHKIALWLDSSNWKHFLFFESQRWQQLWDKQRLFPVLLFISTTFALNFQVLEGNSNAHEVKKNIIPVIYARYFLLIPLKWYHWTCTRMEVYGEPWPEGISLYLIYKLQWRSIIPRARVCLFFFFLITIIFRRVIFVRPFSWHVKVSLGSTTED